MKKLLFVILIITFVLSSLTAQSQKLYDYDSSVYEVVSRLCLINGVVGPSSSTPITQDELYIALKRVNENKLDLKHKRVYAELNEILSDDSDLFKADVNLYTSPQLFYSTEYEKIDQNEYFYPYNKQNGFIELDICLEFGNSAFFETNYELMNNSIVIGGGIPLSSFSYLLDYRNGELMPLGKSPVVTYGEFPAKARGAIGNKWMNLVIGRSRQQMGNGITGNMVIGDNYKFQELLDFTFISNSITYSLNLTHYDLQDGNAAIIHTRYNGLQQHRIMHRIDVAAKPNLRFVFNLGATTYTNNPFDFRYLIPLFMVHNLYNYEESLEIREHDEANNIMSFEVEYAFAPRWLLTGQLVVDQFKTAIETTSTLPNAIGGLINLSYLKMCNNCDAKYWLELIYTSESLYLNKKRSQLYTPDYNLDWALGYYRRDTIGDLAWSGYIFGPGVISTSVGTNLSFINIPLEIKTSISYRKNKNINYQSQMGDNNDLISHSLGFEALSKYMHSKKLEALFGFNVSYIWNYKFGESNKMFIQALLGCKFQLF